MVFTASAEVTEARGVAVSGYLDVKGAAEITVEGRDSLFSNGEPGGVVSVSVSKLKIRDMDDMPVDLSKYTDSFLGKPQTFQLDGWDYQTTVSTGSAKVEMEIHFHQSVPGKTPDSVTAAFYATGRGLASLAFKALTVKISGTAKA